MIGGASYYPVADDPNPSGEWESLWTQIGSREQILTGNQSDFPI
jgi:hypothetical protein